MMDTMDPVSAVSDVSVVPYAGLALRLGAAVSAAKVDHIAEDFESMFATQMLQPMFEGIGVNEMFGGGHGEEVMRSFLLQEYGKIIAKSDKLGIASQVKAEMLRAQEGSGVSRGTKKTDARLNASVMAYTGGAHVAVR